MDTLQPQSTVQAELTWSQDTATSHLRSTQGVALVSAAAESHKNYKINVYKTAPKHSEHSSHY